MSKYKLIYFDVRGRGEVARMLFTVAGVSFEDKRVPVDAVEWDEMKSKMPQHVLPVLEVDGKQLSQSLTICRYLAREFHLCGKTAWEQAKVEEIVDTMEDLRLEVAKWIYEKNETKKNEISEHLKEQVYPKFAKILETSLRGNEENDNSSGYLVGENLTLADLSVFETLTFPLTIHPSILDDHIELQQHRHRIKTHKRLSDYISNRPLRPV
ncbi:probable glutathione S-transferase 9 isoform X2 [Mya arenaria]|uniref:probable glutathione S-transferase 9 isoform X2 n=1 Tax=Mya arenaria TaxID=6604 RepID=UPI0022E65C7F|nr:probable glutathione S-transferase 9 isoform X2 [Mya arenaria]